MNPLYHELKDLASKRSYWSQKRQSYRPTRYFQPYSLEQIQETLDKVISEYQMKLTKYNDLQSTYKSIQSDQQKFRGINALAVYEQKLNEFKIEKNRYHKSMEGMSCRRYRGNWSEIMKHCAFSSYFSKMKAFIETLDSLVKIIGQSKPTLTLEECQKARLILADVDDKWKRLQKSVYVNRGMPPKYHYLGECVEFVCYWRMPLGYCNEQSVEAFHQICNRLRRNYLNQRGELRVKYMMDKLLHIACPKLCDQYAHAVDDKK